MEFFQTPAKANRWCIDQRNTGKIIGMVPTMGALHEGHLELVKRAVKENDIFVVSIFVNPLQFNEEKDFSAYPRNLEQDRIALKNCHCAMAFTGSLDSFFPRIDRSNITLLRPGAEANDLEGAHRPGHFAGVKTIVNKLFTTVRPHNAYFGEKDFQQTLVIRKLAKETSAPNIIVCPTHREKNGLAMSSRNERLTSNQRQQASVIYRALLAALSEWKKGVRGVKELEKAMVDVLATETDLKVEYATVRDPENWQEKNFNNSATTARALIAVTLGNVRLIDNMILS